MSNKGKTNNDNKYSNADLPFEFILNSTNVLVAYLDTQFNIIWVNKAFADTNGKKLSFFTGKNLFDVFPSDENKKLLQQVVKDGIPYYDDARPFIYEKNPERGISYWDCSIIPTFEDSKTTGLIITAINVTKQKSAEKTLLESEERYRIVADFAYDWEYWITPEGKYVYISPSCKRITGYSADDFFKDPELFSKIVHPDDRTDVIKHLKGESQNDEVHNLDFRIINKHGETLWISHFCQPVVNDKGQFLGRRASNRDITQRIKAEEIREELILDLQKAAKEIKILNGYLPICSSCKKIRDDKGYWKKLEAYISSRSTVEFTHALCPDCLKTLYPELLSDDDEILK